MARFKDLTGVSRKYAIPLLEYLDREHVTRRVGDERVILVARTWPRIFTDLLRLRPLVIREDPWRSLSDFLFRKLHLQPQRIGEAVGQIGQADQQMQVDDLRVGEMLLQLFKVGVGDVSRGAGQLFRVGQGGLFFLGEAGVVAVFQRFPVCLWLIRPAWTTPRDAAGSNGSH